MSVRRDGWLGGREFAAGEDGALVCMRCECGYSGRDDFLRHDCEAAADTGDALEVAAHESAIEFTTHSLTRDQAVALIEGLTDVARLRAMRAGEKQHPSYAGGRKGVLEAIEQRLEELGEPLEDAE